MSTQIISLLCLYPIQVMLSGWKVEQALFQWDTDVFSQSSILLLHVNNFLPAFKPHFVTEMMQAFPMFARLLLSQGLIRNEPLLVPLTSLMSNDTTPLLPFPCHFVTFCKSEFIIYSKFKQKEKHQNLSWLALTSKKCEILVLEVSSIA